MGIFTGKSIGMEEYRSTSLAILLMSCWWCRGKTRHPQMGNGAFIKYSKINQCTKIFLSACGTRQPFHNIRLNSTTETAADHCAPTLLFIMFTVGKDGFGCKRGHAIIGFSYGLPCYVYNMAFGPQLQKNSDHGFVFLHSGHVHDDVIKWKHFPCYSPFVRGIHRSSWLPRTKAIDAELWCFWSAPGPTYEQTMETPVIWDAITPVMTPL